MSRLISRDPFARTELHRTTIRNTGVNHSCDWCGREPANRCLYQYYTESDGGSKWHEKGHFCCKSCRDDYHS